MKYEFYVGNKSGDFFPYKLEARSLDKALCTLANLVVDECFDFKSIGYDYYVTGKNGSQTKRPFTRKLRHCFFDYYENALLFLVRS